MKKVLLRFIGAAVLCGAFLMFSQAASASENAQNKEIKMKKVLVAYYSWSGNTAEIAKMIQKETGGDIFEIQVVKPYPSEYNATTEQAKKRNKGRV